MEKYFTFQVELKRTSNNLRRQHIQRVHVSFFGSNKISRKNNLLKTNKISHIFHVANEKLVRRYILIKCALCKRNSKFDEINARMSYIRLRCQRFVIQYSYITHLVRYSRWHYTAVYIIWVLFYVENVKLSQKLITTVVLYLELMNHCRHLNQRHSLYHLMSTGNGIISPNE